jgi:putative ABC transport system permease protein
MPNRIYAADEHVTEIIGGELVLGRWFTRGELASGASVVVLPESYARQLLGRANPIGKVIKVAGRPAEVIGLYGPETNIFQPPGVETEAIIPFLMAWQQIPFDKTQQMMIAVKPRKEVTLDAATEAVTIALREMRRLHPTDKNSFDIMTQEDLLDRFNKLSGAFFLVMIVLSSVGLLVGGIGVMAIMMVSVTSRTREIGVRKALGASRRDIMLQFLIESCTLTGVGGAIGVATGLLFGRVIGFALQVSAPPPLTPTIAAVFVSVGIGIVFGLIPARRAAQMDPVEALRYE